jgi:hypothetical protein
MFIYLFIHTLINLAFQKLRLYSVEWKGDKWIVNWKGFGRERSWPNFTVLYYNV